MKHNHGYHIHNFHSCIDSYLSVYDYWETTDEWDNCPCCGLKPRFWSFNNGLSTACGCWENTYDHFSIHAESIMSVFKRTGNTLEYTRDNLRTNWNHWCQTGEILFEHASKRDDDRW